MGLNKAKGNMYGFVSHTWNTVKGKCSHDCSYCYCKAMAHRFDKPQRDTFFDEKELKTNLGKGNFIFVGSSNDMFAREIPEKWIIETIKHCNKYEENKYLFQTKNPENIRRVLPYNSTVCVTLESNRFIKEHMGNAPEPCDRVDQMVHIRHKLHITIEPIMKFDLKEFVGMAYDCAPEQINIGANSGNIKLPEPSKEEVLQLIEELSKFTKVHLKPNLNRLIR